MGLNFQIIEVFMTRQNKAIIEIKSLIEDLQEMLVSEHSLSNNNLQLVILRLCEISNLIE